MTMEYYPSNLDDEIHDRIDSIDSKDTSNSRVRDYFADFELIIFL